MRDKSINAHENESQHENENTVPGAGEGIGSRHACCFSSFQKQQTKWAKYNIDKAGWYLNRFNYIILHIYPQLSNYEVVIAHFK